VANFKKTEKELEKFADGVVRAARINLQKSKASGGLMDSVRHELNVTKRKDFVSSFSLKFYFDDYGDYLDKGVDGTRKKQNAPYSFKKETVAPAHQLSMQKWAKKKGIRARDSKGKFTNKASAIRGLSYVLARSVKRKGIKKTQWFTKAFTTKYKKFDEVQRVFALDYAKFLAQTLNETNGNN
jgi:hypothetical protein